jgi:hypothetical protein
VHEVCGNEVQTPVSGVAARRNGRRIRRPHCRRAARATQQFRCTSSGVAHDRFVGSREATTSKRLHVWPFVGGKDGLFHAELPQPRHLCETLAGCRAWVREATAASIARQIPLAQAGVVVRRTDETVEVDFVSGHDFRSIPGASFAGIASVSDSIVATG